MTIRSIGDINSKNVDDIIWSKHYLPNVIIFLKNHKIVP